jgi:hypothetical protein
MRGAPSRTNWADYALLRDNIQHYLESGVPSARFAALHAIERAVDGNYAEVDAGRLRREVLGGWYSLKKLDFESFAVSLRTHSILSGSSPPSMVEATQLAARAGWSLPVTMRSEQPLGEVLRSFVQAVLIATQTPIAGDKLVVTSEQSASSKAGQPPPTRPASIPAHFRTSAAGKARD